MLEPCKNNLIASANFKKLLYSTFVVCSVYCVPYTVPVNACSDIGVDCVNGNTAASVHEEAVADCNCSHCCAFNVLSLFDGAETETLRSFADCIFF